MKRAFPFLYSTILFCLSFALLAHADGGLDGGVETVTTVASAAPTAGFNVWVWLYDCAHDPQLFWVVTVGLSAIVFILRSKVALGRWKWFKSETGGQVMLALTALSGSFGVAWGAGENWGWKAILVAAAHAFGAAFGWDFSREKLGLSANKAKPSESPAPTETVS